MAVVLVLEDATNEGRVDRFRQHVYILYHETVELTRYESRILGEINVRSLNYIQCIQYQSLRAMQPFSANDCFVTMTL